jgi:hypothetical protein
MSDPGNNKLMHHYLLRVIEFGPQVIGETLDQIDEKDWDTPTHPDRFSPREVIAHLRFWEPVAQGRLRAAAENSGSEVLNWDEDQDVFDNDYASKNPRQMLAEWKAERARTAEYIKSVDPAKYNNHVVHGMWGKITFDNLANLAIAHDMYHIEQLANFVSRKS